MKFDLAWLTEHLTTEPDADVLAQRLTASGFLVELRENVAGGAVWDVEITTNRPDAMNHRGLAREAAVAVAAGLRPLAVALAESDEAADDVAAVEIADPELCPRYVARIVRGVRLGPSPEALQRRLERCGVRPINAIVDATNYVLLELGQPLHAFDLARLEGRRIVVRRAHEEERLTTLDGVSRRLQASDLVIADGERAVALAGIMGGADSEIGEGTTDVLIESAHFDALTVRRTARRLGMHTEASHRFERGSDPEIAAVASDAAAEMIARLAGGRVCRGRIDVYPRPWQARRLVLDVGALSAFAGLDIDPSRAAAILDGLGFGPAVDGPRIAVTVPSHRVDVERVADLYEEVLRHVGYGTVPARLPVLRTEPGRRHPNWELVDRGRQAAIAAGLAEVVTWSFVDPDDDALVDGLPGCPGSPLALANPLAQTQAIMRRSLLPGLLAAARASLNRGERRLAVFEEGRVFASEDGQPREAERIGVVLSGTTEDGRVVDFADLKGRVEAILDGTCFPVVEWRRGGSPWLDEDQGATLEVEGAPIGCAGLLAAELAARWDLRQPLYVAELDLGAAMATPPMPQYRPLPRFPAVTADMTVEHPVGLEYRELIGAVEELAGELVESMELENRYSGDELEGRVVRTTLRLVYRHPERSLTQDEVNAAQDRLREALARRLGVGFA